MINFYAYHLVLTVSVKKIHIHTHMKRETKIFKLFALNNLISCFIKHSSQVLLALQLKNSCVKSLYHRFCMGHFPEVIKLIVVNEQRQITMFILFSWRRNSIATDRCRELERERSANKFGESRNNTASPSVVTGAVFFLFIRKLAAGGPYNNRVRTTASVTYRSENRRV